MQGDPGDLSELARALLTGDLSPLEQLIRDGGRAGRRGHASRTSCRSDFFSRRTLEQMGAEGAAEELRDLAARLEPAGMSPEQIRRAAPT